MEYTGIYKIHIAKDSYRILLKIFYSIANFQSDC